MLACVERRFATLRAPHPVQWLADNGSAYTARETLDFAAALSLVPCFTPVRSPESNGVSEAFVKTRKRDYARIQPRPDAPTVCSSSRLGRRLQRESPAPRLANALTSSVHPKPIATSPVSGLAGATPRAPRITR
jgi:transposase InsO family protein